MSFVKILKSLGGGLQGDVALCLDSNGQEFILKRFYATKDFALERDILARCQGSPYAAQAHSVALPAHCKNGLALKFYQRGDLFEIISAAHNNNRMTERLAKSMFKKILLAVADVHEKEIAHRDIKPENIFLDNEFNIVVGDFGLASVQYESKVDNRELVDVCGSRGYMSPEVIDCEKTGRKYDGYAADMWSLACLLFLILTGNMPLGLPGACRKDWYYNCIAAGNWTQFWAQHESVLATPLSTETKEIVELLFAVNPSQRLTATQALELPWFKDETMLSDHQYFQAMEQISLLAV